AGRLAADQAKHSAPGVLPPPAACAIRRSTMCTAPPVGEERLCRYDRGVRILRGSATCSAAKTRAASLARRPRALLTRSPAQHAGRIPHLSSPSRTLFLRPSDSLISSLDLPHQM